MAMPCAGQGTHFPKLFAPMMSRNNLDLCLYPSQRAAARSLALAPRDLAAGIPRDVSRCPSMDGRLSQRNVHVSLALSM